MYGRRCWILPTSTHPHIVQILNACRDFLFPATTCSLKTRGRGARSDIHTSLQIQYMYSNVTSVFPLKWRAWKLYLFQIHESYKCSSSSFSFLFIQHPSGSKKKRGKKGLQKKEANKQSKPKPRDGKRRDDFQTFSYACLKRRGGNCMRDLSAKRKLEREEISK